MAAGEREKNTQTPTVHEKPASGTDDHHAAGKERGSHPDHSQTETLVVTDSGVARAGAAREEIAPSGDELPLGDFSLPARFEFQRVLGRGGMGLVVLAADKTLDRDVAVKILPPAVRANPTLKRRFLREARAAATLEHPGIVTVHDIDQEHGFIVMEVVRGESLKDWIGREGALPRDEVRRVGASLLSALAVAHEAGVVHRDVKPSNLLIAEDGELKLADFGVASFGDSDLTTTGAVIGTPAYMPPEQLRGRDVTPAADVYSAGATLFEAATGHKLHAATGTVKNPAELVEEKTGDRVLAIAIARAVAEDPEARFTDARAFADALGSRVLVAPPSTGRRPGIGRTLAWVGGACVAAAAGIAGVGWISDDQIEPTGPSVGDVQTSGRLALLPFEDRSDEASLDFAASGLPQLLAMELQRADGVSVVGYHRLLEQLPDADVPLDRWRRAARDFEADAIVRGVLRPAADGVRVEIVVEQPDGTEIDRISRDVAPEHVPRTVRSLAPEIATVALGGAIDIATGAERTFDVERNLALGIAAVEEHRLAEAVEHLQSALRGDPDSAVAHYHLALAYFWQSKTGAWVVTEVDAALGGDELHEVQRSFLEGLRFLASYRFVEAAEHFERAIEDHPADRDILFGYFEALYHSGRPREGLAVYRSLVQDRPGFKLGLIHALYYYCHHGEEEGIAWAVQRADVLAEGSAYWRWGAASLWARRDFDGALGAIEELKERFGNPGTDEDAWVVAQMEVHVHSARGDYDRAVQLQRELAALNRGKASFGMYSLAVARGDPAEIARWQTVSSQYTAMSTRGWGRLFRLLELAHLEPDESGRERFEELDQLLDTAWDDGTRTSVTATMAELFLAWRLRDAERMRAVRRAEHPEPAGAMEGYLALLDEDWTTAAEAFERVVYTGHDGRYVNVYRTEAARAYRGAGDHASVVRNCEAIIEPRYINQEWGAFIASCLLWTGDAQRALGDPGAARTAYERLLRLRAPAPRTDELVVAARAGIAALD